jgi:transposase
MPVSKVAACVKVTAPRIWRVFNYWIERAKSQDDLSAVCQLGIDETSSKKGHQYVTTFVDMEQRRVIDVQQGKDMQTVTDFVEELELKGGDRKQIEEVCIDMSPAFIAGTLNMFPNSQITFDKFHMIQHLNDATVGERSRTMDEVRKKERIGNELIKNHKYTFLRLNKNLPERKRSELAHIMMLYPILGEAYRLKEMFLDVFHIKDPDEAKGYLQFWCDMVMETAIQPFKKFVNIIKAHWFGIVNYFESKLTNGILEGINTKIQLAKRRARGYRNVNSFMNMIMFLCGKLKFDYPHFSL